MAESVVLGVNGQKVRKWRFFAVFYTFWPIPDLSLPRVVKTSWVSKKPEQCLEKC